MDNNILQKIKDLHQKYKAGDFPDLYFDLIWTHSDIIRKIALRIADELEKKRNIKVDRELIEIGSMVHDIGYYQCFDDELNVDCKVKPILHGFQGAEILKKENLPKSWQRFCLVHSATGFTKEDIEREHMPVQIDDYLPITIEEEIVTYADKFHTKYPAFDSYDNLINRIGKFDPDRKVRFVTLSKKYGVPNTEDLSGEYELWSTEINKKITEAIENKKKSL
jgi:uncharacterized protein